RILANLVLQTRTISDGRHAMYPQTVEEALDGGFGAAPLRRVQFSEQMDGAHELGGSRLVKCLCRSEVAFILISTRSRRQDVVFPEIVHACQCAQENVDGIINGGMTKNPFGGALQKDAA